MSRVIVALDPGPGRRLATALADEGVDALELGGSAVPAGPVLEGAHAIVLPARRDAITPALITACDRRGVRILALADTEADARAARALGIVQVLPADAAAWQIAQAVILPAPAVTTVDAPAPTRVIAVWGPSGAPGRSTLAIELAAELARGARTVALVDADTHAPSLALALGIPDEGPGFAAACRRTERDALDAAELGRISVPVPVPGGAIDVLTGINRPSRWPELSAARVHAALEACRGWTRYVVVDVAAALERDEEIVSDLDGPHRNAATLAALRAADTVVAVMSADPLGVSRFVRGVGELRAAIGGTRIVAVANRLRAGGLGIDSRGQLRRTLERFAGIDDVAFLPLDPRSTDAAMLAARPLAEIAPRSPFVLAVRRLAADVLAPAATIDLSDVDPQRSRVRPGSIGRGRRRVAASSGR